MPPLSESVNLAWRLAADESVRSGQSRVEPSHLLLGICRVGQALSEENLERYGIIPGSEANMRQEWNQVRSVVRTAGLDPTLLLQEGRSFNPRKPGPTQPTNVLVNRSDSARAVFERAEHQAAKNGRPRTTLFDLLNALVPALLEDISALTPGLATSLQRLKAYLTLSAVSDVSVSMDASRTDGDRADLAAKPHEALLCDLPLQMASQPNFQSLLDCVLASLMKFFPSADRTAILLRDPTSDSLLLQAHLPAGEPCASLQLSTCVLQSNTALVRSPGPAFKGELGNQSLMELQCTSAMYVPLCWQAEQLGVICVDTKRANVAFTADDLRLLIAVAHHVALSIHSNRLNEELRSKNLILERLLTHFSPKVRQRLLERAVRGRLALGGERSQVSILFSDIRGFTNMSATMEPDDVVDTLNAYFGVLVDAIFQYGGTVDKFIGDAILAVFGSPYPDPDHHKQALRAGLAMQDAMRKLNLTRKGANLPVCEIGVGIHSGEVVHGFIGTQERIEFTVVGDAVNRASRYCSAAGPNEILLSQELHRHVWREIYVEPRKVETKHEGDWTAFRVLKLKTVAPV